MQTDHTAIITRLVRVLNERDYDLWETLVTEDYLEEYPQSGELIRGPKNVRASVENYPGGISKDALDLADARVTGKESKWVRTPTFTFVRVEGRGNVGTAAFKGRYPTEPPGGSSFSTSCEAIGWRRPPHSSLRSSRLPNGASHMSTARAHEPDEEGRCRRFTKSSTRD